MAMKGVAALLLAAPASAYDNGAPHSRKPPLGWSSWVGLGQGWDTDKAQAPSFDFCDEVSVKKSIDAFHEVGLYDAGYRHFHLDDCWADKERNATGFLQAERDHFPNGMKPIVDYAHSKGLTFGLYTCAGTYTCVGGRPGSRGHFTQDANVFAEWEVDAVKMDWCNTEGMIPEDTYPKFSEALNKTGRHIHFNMCEWGLDAPWTWGPKVAQSWRATGDHVGHWEGRGGTKEIIDERTAIPASAAGTTYAWNDMDMLETGNYKQAAHANGKQGNMTAVEYRTEFSMWAIFASTMVVTTPILNCSKTDQINGDFTPGTCVPSITALQKEILLNKEVLAINQDESRAGSLILNMTGSDVRVYSRALSDGTMAVAFYNPSDSSGYGYVNFEALGWEGSTKAAVRDLWAHSDLGTVTGSYPPLPLPPVTVEAHATLLLRLTPAKESAVTVV